MARTNAIEGCEVIDRVLIADHLFVEMDPAVYACERCGLIITVDPDGNPLRALKAGGLKWIALGRDCA